MFGRDVKPGDKLTSKQQEAVRKYDVITSGVGYQLLPTAKMELGPDKVKGDYYHGVYEVSFYVDNKKRGGTPPKSNEG